MSSYRWEYDYRKNAGSEEAVKYLAVAVANTGMINYTLNWRESLRHMRQDDKYLVFAIDQGLVDIMNEKGYEQRHFDSNRLVPSSVRFRICSLEIQ